MSRITLRLPESVHARLVTVARNGGKSINQVIVETLDQALDPESPQGIDAQRFRQALGDLVADASVLLAGLSRPDVPLLPHEELQRRMPRLSVPLSEAIIRDREDRI